MRILVLFERSSIELLDSRRENIASALDLPTTRVLIEVDAIVWAKFRRFLGGASGSPAMHSQASSPN